MDGTDFLELPANPLGGCNAKSEGALLILLSILLATRYAQSDSAQPAVTAASGIR